MMVGFTTRIASNKQSGAVSACALSEKQQPNSKVSVLCQEAFYPLRAGLWRIVSCMLVIFALFTFRAVSAEPFVRDFSAAKIQKIRINGAAAHLTLKESKSAAVKVTVIEGKEWKKWRSYYPDNYVKIFVDGSQLVVEVEGPATKERWRRTFKNTSPDLNITVEGPARPVEVSLRNLKMDVQGWTSSLALHAIELSVRALKTQGAIDAWCSNGDISLREHNGPLNFRGSADLTLANVTGPIKANSFAGKMRLERASGEINLNSASGEIEVIGGKGQLTFYSGKKQVDLRGFEGSIIGEADDGSVSIHPKGPPQIRVKTQGASVALQISKGVGASVYLRSNDGYIQAPPPLSVDRHANYREVKGYLRGSPRGKIYVRTRLGAISMQ